MGYKWNEFGINEITNLFLYGQDEKGDSEKGDRLLF